MGWFSSIKHKASAITHSIGDHVSSAASSVTHSVGDHVSSAISSVKHAVGGVAEKIGDTTKNVADKVGDTTTHVAKSIEKDVGKILGGTKDFIEHGQDTASTIITGLGNDVKGTVTGVASSLSLPLVLAGGGVLVYLISKK